MLESSHRAPLAPGRGPAATSVEPARLHPNAAALPPGAAGEQRVEVPATDLAAACAAAAEVLPGRLATMIGYDDRAQSGRFRLAYVFAVADGWLSVETALDPATPEFPSVTPLLPAADWYEREVHDLLGLVPAGHPDPRRLVLHENWPDGCYPLRKDVDPASAVPVAELPPARFHHLHGEGIVEIPVGPIHAGVIEPGHFRFAAVGELVLHVEARLFYTHRGIEKVAEGKSAAHGVQIAERICGSCAVSHAVSYCQAIEAIAEVTPPPRAAAVRTAALELERLYNHIGDLGNICAGTGFAVGNSQGLRLKDALQRLNERLTGNRFLRGLCRPGGVRRDLDASARHDIQSTLGWLAPEFARFADLLLTTESFMERLVGTGRLDPAVAARQGVVGVAARASGLHLDARLDHPHAAYAWLPLSAVVMPAGDVLARTLVRIGEVHAALTLLRELLDHLPPGPMAADFPERLPPLRTALGVTESPRGENIHWVRSGADGMIDRYRVRSASFPNWAIVPATVPGNMVPDFPLINKSFELCYACLDR